MAESVDSLAVAVERSNIFAVPEASRDSEGTGVEPARTVGVFARVGSSSATSGEADSIPQPRGRFSSTAASRWAAAGVSTRSSVCVAVVVAAVMAGLVLHELGEPPGDPRVQLNTRPVVGVEGPMRASAARQRVANQKTKPSIRRRTNSRRSRSRESSVRRPRARGPDEDVLSQRRVQAALACGGAVRPATGSPGAASRTGDARRAVARARCAAGPRCSCAGAGRDTARVHVIRGGRRSLWLSN